MARDLLSKRLLIVSGKGGVGKTVISSAIGMIAASRGQKVLLIKMDDQGRTAELFESNPVSDQISPLRDGISALNLDPITVVSDYFTKQLKIKRLVKHIIASRLFQNWFRVSPAIKEMICLGKVWDLVDEKTWWRSAPKWDLILFDAPATGHGLGLLRLPEQASKLLIGPLRTNALGVQAVLEDAERTGLLLVTLPEEMPVNETVHFHTEARAKVPRVAQEAVILNSAAPDRFGETTPDPATCETDAAKAAMAALIGSEIAPEIVAEAFRHATEVGQARAALTKRYREELKQRIRLPLVEVPYVFSAAFGFAQLERISTILERKLIEAELIPEREGS
ncbi:MAG: ArsA family ATPase [Planctomycetes bacterium]|nr:ArsA family ATPase [Planctomycetota bacterium]